MSEPSDRRNDDGADEPPLDFDPYRFGRPEHPIPPEYAPPGYRPPEPTGPAAAPLPGGPPPGAPPGPYVPPQRGQAPYPPGYTPGYPPGYPPGAYPPPPYGGHGYPVARNGKAVAAMVLGILALVFFWSTVFDIPFIVLAIVFGALGRRDARRQPQLGGRSQATSGLVCGIIAAALMIATSVFVFAKVRPCLDDGHRFNSTSYNQCVKKQFGQ